MFFKKDEYFAELKLQKDGQEKAKPHCKEELDDDF